MRALTLGAVGAMLLAILFQCCPSAAPEETPVTSPPTATQKPIEAEPTATRTIGRTQARVASVIDGDTFEVEIDGQIYSVRYIGIDAPEMDDRRGAAKATEVNPRLVGGQIVQLEKDVSETDRYGRLLRYVYVGSLFVNAELVRLGCAAAMTNVPDVACAGLFVQLQQDAREAGRGLWGYPAPEPPTPTSLPVVSPTAPPSPGNITVDLSCCQFNAPGDDAANKVEEYVCFSNNGAQAVNMENWTLTDEYGWSYTFPAFALDAGAIVRVRTGCGQNTATDLYWCHGGASAIWNNDGDIVFLFDARSALVAQYSY